MTNSGEIGIDYKETLLNHVLRDKTGSSLTIAQLLKFVCRRIGIQVDVIRTSIGAFLGVTPETPADPYEIVFNMEAERLSPKDCEELTSQYDRNQSSPLTCYCTL